MKTLEETPSLKKIYNKELEKYPALSHEDNIKYARLYRSGDASARDILINGNLRLVFFLLIRYQGLPFYEDLLQEANLGLMEAIERFDPEMGCRLSTYAAYWVHESVCNFMINNHLVRVPKYLIKKIRSFITAKESLMQGNPKIPSHEEIATEMQKPIEEVEKIAGYIDKSFFRYVLSENQVLSKYKGEFEDYDYGDFPVLCESNDFQGDLEFDNDKISAIFSEEDPLSHENDINKSEFIEKLKSFMGFLEERECEILKKVFGMEEYAEPLSLRDIAKEYGISPEAVRLIKNKALDNLKNLFIVNNFGTQFE